MAIEDRPAHALTAPQATAYLRQHCDLCRELLTLVEAENRALQKPGDIAAGTFAAGRKILLSRLVESNKKLKEVVGFWQQLGATDRQREGEIAGLIRQSQELIMKVVVLDRENEQALLRRGLVPAGQLPPAQRQRPHFVAELYRQRGPA